MHASTTKAGVKINGNKKTNHQSCTSVGRGGGGSI